MFFVAVATLDVTNVVLAIAGAVQALFAILLWRVSSQLNRLQRDHFEQGGPLFVVHFNGIQNHPSDPKRQMLRFLMSVSNAGRSAAQIASMGVLVMLPNGKWEEHHHWGIPRELIEWGQEGPSFALDYFGPDSQHAKGQEYLIPPYHAKTFLIELPANGGWERWEAVRIYAMPIGGKRAERDVNWMPLVTTAMGLNPVPSVPRIKTQAQKTGKRSSWSRVKETLAQTGLSLALLGGLGLAFSTAGFYKLWDPTLMHPIPSNAFAWIVLATAFISLGIMILGVIFQRGDARVWVISLCSIVLWMTMFILVIQEPNGFLGTFAGALSGIIIATAASSRETFQTFSAKDRQDEAR